MATAHFRITLWQAKKPKQPLSRLVTEDDARCAVSVAQQWVCWSNSQGRGKRLKYDGYRVEIRGTNGAWTTVREGDRKDAEAEQAQNSVAETVFGDGPSTGYGYREAVKAFGTPRSRRGPRKESRLAQIVARVKDRA